MLILKKIVKKIKTIAEFMPYSKELDIKGIQGEFFYSTHQAKEWYDPLKPYAKLEYEWVINNIPLEGKNILDGGSHHGQYSLVFGLAAKKDYNLMSIDPFPMNCSITKVNLKLNNIDSKIIQKAISTKIGTTNFTTESNGRISKSGNMIVQTTTLEDLMPNVDVIKLDIEGHEFEVIPHSLDKLKQVSSWIVEVHPAKDRNPDDLINLFNSRNYEVYWVNRQTNEVEKYTLGTTWNIHSTIFAVRKISV